MNLLAPSALWWLLALAVLLLLPRIRFPRSRRPVATLHLWMPSDADERPRPTVLLLRNLALVLQALAIVALVAALAQPVLDWRSRTLTVVVDVSASMGAREGSGTRLDAARRVVLDEAAALPFGSTVRLVTAGAEATSRGEFGARSSTLRSALDQLQPGATGARLPEAIDTALDIGDADVLVISDTPPIENVRARWRQVGSTVPNVGLTTFAARRLVDSPLDAELVAEVTNHSESNVTVPLVVASSAGDLVRQVLTIQPRQSEVVAIDVPSGGDQFSARIEHDDALTADNTRTTTLDGRVARVAFSGTPSRFTRAAIEVHPLLQVVDAVADADVVICGGCGGVPPGTANVLVTRASAAGVLDRRHPVAAAVAPRTLRAQAVTSGDRRILRVEVDDEDPRVARDSAFPVLIAAAVQWLAEGHRVLAVEWPADESDLHVTATNAAPAAARSEKSAPLRIAAACVLAAFVFLALDWFWIATPKPRRSVLALRAAVTVALAAGILGLHLPLGEAPTAVVFAVDGSRSVSAAARAEAAQAIERLASQMRGGDRVAVVAFGADASVERPLIPGRPDAMTTSEIARGGTDIERALRVSRGVLPPDGSRRIVLLSDGHATRGDALREATAAARAGATIDVVPLRGPAVAGARVISVSAPAFVSSGEAFPINVTIAGSPNTPATYALARDGRELDRQQIVFDTSGTHVLSLTDRIAGNGVVTYTASADGREDADAGAAVSVGGTPAVLYVTETPIRISGGDLRVEQARPEAVPDTPAGLSRYGAVVLDDVAAERLRPQSASALADFVRRTGGGLVLRGTARTLGPAGYPQSSLDTLLPVDFRGRGGQRGSELALVVAFDKSGSMADAVAETTKIELARRAALAVHDVLATGDSLGLIAFDDDATTVVPLSPKGPIDGVRERLRGIAPAGPTRIAPAIRRAREWLDKSAAARRRILLISDGRSDAADAEEVLSLLQDKRVALTIIAAGDDADRAFFRDLSAKTGADVHLADQLAALPSIAAREAVKASGGWIVRERFQARAATTHPLIGDVPSVDLPTFGGYVASVKRERAEAVLVSHLGDPIIATSPAGLGRVVVVTADDVVADAKRTWPDLWTQAIRWAARPASEQLHATIENSRLFVDVVDDGRFVNGLQGHAVLRTPSGEERVTALRLNGPGRYAAALDLAESGTYTVAATLHTADNARAYSAIRGIYRPAPAELTRVGTDIEALTAIARAGGGVVLSGDLPNPFDQPRPRGWVDVSGFATLVALILMLVEIAVRRGLSLRAWRRREVDAWATS